MAKAGHTTLRAMERVLLESACTIKIREKDLRKWPDDPEHLHQYRISLRVARSLVKFLRPYLRPARAEKLLAGLKTLQDPTSRMRELDVLVETLEGIPELQEACRAVQLANREDFLAALAEPEAQELLAQVQEGLANMPWKREVLRRGIPAKKIAARIDAVREECEHTLAELDFDNQEAVHDLRKKAKSLRYVSRELAPILPEGAGAVSGQMRAVQDVLGAWCDARVNATLILEILGDDYRDFSDPFSTLADQIMRDLKAERPSS